jgi:hypothetical protein
MFQEPLHAWMDAMCGGGVGTRVAGYLECMHVQVIGRL